MRPKAKLLAWAMIGKITHFLPRILEKAQFGGKVYKRGRR